MAAAGDPTPPILPSTAVPSGPPDACVCQNNYPAHIHVHWLPSPLHRRSRHPFKEAQSAACLQPRSPELQLLNREWRRHRVWVGGWGGGCKSSP